MLTIILCTIIWIIVCGAFLIVLKFYDDMDENDKEKNKAKVSAIILFIFQLLCFGSVLSAVAKW